MFRVLFSESSDSAAQVFDPYLFHDLSVLPLFLTIACALPVRSSHALDHYQSQFTSLPSVSVFLALRTLCLSSMDDTENIYKTNVNWTRRRQGD